MTVVPIAARAAAVRGGSSAAAKQGAGKVIDVTPSSSRPLRNVKSRPRAERVSDAAAGAGASKLIDGGQLGRGAKAATDLVAPASHARRILVAEFALCMVVLAFSPLTDKNKSEKPGAFMKRASATMGVFFILGLVATGGRGASRAAAGFGGLVALVLLISQRSIFTVLTAKMGKGVGEDDFDREGWNDAGEGVGDIIGDVGDIVGGGVPDPGTRPTPELTPLPPLGPGGGNGGIW